MVPGEAKKSNSITALVTLIATTILLVGIFQLSRSSDVGRIPQNIGRLFEGNLFSTEGMIVSLLATLVAILIFCAWFGFGKLLTIRFEDNQPMTALDFARTCAFGAGAWSLIWFFTGFGAGYNVYAAILFLLVGLVIAIYFVVKKPFFLKNEGDLNTGAFGKVVFGLLVFGFFIMYLSALAPPTAKDALLYHAALPKEFIAQGSNQIIEGNIASYLALGVEMHSLWARLLGSVWSVRTGEAAMGATIFMFTPLLSLAVFGWSREFGIEKGWSLLSALLVTAIPTVFHIASSLYVDVALALFVTLAIHSLTKWWRDLQTKWLVFTAIALGVALSIKLTAVFVAISLILIILLRARKSQNEDQQDGEPSTGEILLKGLAAIMAAGFIASPWYLRTWILTGSPIFPFYMNIWRGTANGWDTERSMIFQQMNSNYGGANKGFLDYVLAPFKISFLAQPEIPALYDGVLGVSFLLGLILIIWAWRRYNFPVELKVAVGTSGIIFLFWLFSSQQLRYLLPVIPSLAVGIIVAANLISQDDLRLRRWLFATLTITAMAGMLTSTAWFVERNPLRVVLGGETRDDYLTKRLDYYIYYKTINNELPNNVRIWLINMRRDTYNLERPYFSDYLFEDWTVKNLAVESQNINDMRQKAKLDMNITHVLARRDDLLSLVVINGKKTSIFDQDENARDRRSDAENIAKLKMLEEFILDKSNRISADEKFSLVALP